MLTATNTNTTSTRFSAASIVAGMITPALATTQARLPPRRPCKTELTQLLEAAHDLEDLIERQQADNKFGKKRDPYRPRRLITIRHPNMDLDALGAPR
jgi:hypothetical protein